MARGWESKSVESQQSERLEPEYRAKPSREEIERNRKREGLEMSRRRVQHELETSRTATHRTALEHALRYLDDEIGKL
jgi:hypothetical protein